jgi:hypothetical protein
MHDDLSIAGWDDEQLLAALRESLRASEEVPPELIEAAKRAYAWHNIDAELARLTYDSTRDENQLSLRAETASIRALTFTSAHLTIELEVTEDSLLGQVISPRGGAIEVQTLSGAPISRQVDGIGRFAIKPVPASQFRLQFRDREGTDVLTEWITL